MNILGISAFYHDSAAALIVDGKIVAAAQEERFTRKKHDHAFPRNAIDYCCQEAGIEIEDIDYCVFYEKPLLKFERLLETYISYWPRGFSSFRRFLPVWVQQKLFLAREIKNGLDKRFQGKLVYPGHHESHAASAFFPSPFEDAAILTIDGVGEWDTTTLGHGVGNKIEMKQTIQFPHSLGLLYSALTYYTGFRVNSGEYKLMGLAPYGEPRYVDKIKETIEIRDDGSFWMDMSYFTYAEGLRMTGKKFEDLMGRPRREPEGEIDNFYMDVAASIQKVTEEIVLKLAAHAKKVTGSDNLVLAGGVALNCVANGRIVREGPFEKVWIQPAAGDAGGALGGALLTWYQLLNKKRTPGSPDGQTGSYLGEQSTEKEIVDFLESKDAVYERYDTDEELAARVAGLMANEKVVGLHQGRMEFGPRALGGRSIIGDARSTEMQKTMNLKIKFRESFRPFAPVILQEKVDDYFVMEPNQESPYMLLVAPVQESKRYDCAEEIAAARGLEKLYVNRSEVPAITHVDFSARVQTVDKERHGLFRKITEAFYAETGSPVIINTSFNVRGEPIVRTPSDSYHCFMGTNMDVLVLENYVLLKEDQPNAEEIDIDAYLAQFALD